MKQTGGKLSKIVKKTPISAEYGHFSVAFLRILYNNAGINRVPAKRFPKKTDNPNTTENQALTHPIPEGRVWLSFLGLLSIPGNNLKFLGD